MRKDVIAGLVLFCLAGSACSASSRGAAELARAPLSVPASSAPGGTPAPSGTAPAPGSAAPGSVTMTDPADGLSLTLPAGFRRITDPQQLQQIVSGAKTILPKGSAQAAQASLKLIKIYAIKRNPISDFSSTVNVIAHDIGTAEDPAEIESIYPQASQEIASIGGTVIGHQPVTVAGQPGLQLSYRLKVSGVNVAGTQIYLIHRTTVFIVTVNDDQDYPSKGLLAAVLAGVRFS